jgi:acetone carboxylase gamma subunit
MKPKSNRNASVKKMKREEGFKLNLTLKLRENDKKLRKTHPKRLLAEKLWKLIGN